MNLNEGSNAQMTFDITVCGNEIMTPPAGAYSVLYTRSAGNKMTTPVSVY